MTVSDSNEWLNQDVRSWIVCESGNRWAIAVRRFAPEIMLPLVPSITTCALNQVSRSLASQHPSSQQSGNHLTQQLSRSRSFSTRRNETVILCEVRKASLLETCGRLLGLRISHPEALLIFAVTELSNQEVRILAEFGFAIMLRHPEELPKFTGLIQDYFATPAQDLD